jgi:hypothetical protein
MTYVVVFRPFNADATIRSRASPCEILGSQSSNNRFLFFLGVLQPSLSVSFHQHTILTIFRLFL